MTSGTGFLQSFWPNFVSDFIVGVLFAAFLAWLAYHLEESSERKQQKEAQLEKTERYLRLLGAEIESLTKALPSMIQAFEATGWGREIRIRTTFWDLVQPGGELPRLLDAYLVAELAKCYDELAYAKRGLDWLIQSWLVPTPARVPGMEEKQAAFIAMTSGSLRLVQNWTPALLDKLKLELDSVKEARAALKERRRGRE